MNIFLKFILLISGLLKTRSLSRRQWLQNCRQLIYLMRDLRFSQQWRFKSRSSGLWHSVVLWQDINVSEVHAASYHNTTWCHNSELLLMKLDQWTTWFGLMIL